MASQSMIRFCEYDAFGFDIDHTIAKYNIPHLFDTCYQAAADFLVNKKGYDPYLLEPFDPSFCIRGLVLDLGTGNFMKLAEDGTVLRASHGTKYMLEDEIKKEYGPTKHFADFEEIIDKVDNIEGKYRIFENFFDIPGSLVCARMVDLMDKQYGGRAPKYTCWPDVIEAFLDSYTETQFAANQGGYFPLFKKETEKFLHPCSYDVKQWLKSLRKKKKKTFIMTSSYVDFASCTMEFVLGPDWQDYFDFFIFFARKPGFFQKDNPFLRLEGFTECEPVEELKEGHFYSQGNVKVFMKSLSQSMNIDEPKVLYFGDSLRSDIFPSKRFAGWENIMILEEMDAEVMTLYKEKPMNEDDPVVPTKRRKVMGPSQLEKEYLTSEHWGSLFTDDHGITENVIDNEKYMNTLWGYMIRKYADVAIPQLEAITDYPLGYKMPVFNHMEKQIWGFHPRIPIALRQQEPSPKESCDVGANEVGEDSNPRRLRSRSPSSETQNEISECQRHEPAEKDFEKSKSQIENLGPSEEKEDTHLSDISNDESEK